MSVRFTTRSMAAILAFSWAVVGACSAQDAGSMPWFERIWEEASQWRPAKPLHIQVVFESYGHVDPVELQQLREAVGKTTDGPERRQLTIMEQQLAHPVRKWTADVCTDGTRFRYASSSGAAGGLQFAIGGGTDWLLLDDGLLRIAPSDIQIPEYGVRNYLHTADKVVRGTIWAGLGTREGGGLRPISSNIEGRNWEGGVALTESGPPLSLVRGQIALAGMPSINGVFIHSRLLADPVARDSNPLGSAQYSAWASNDVVDRFVVSETTWTDAAGRTTQSMKLLKLEYIAANEFESLMEPPSPDSKELWGRAISITAVQDVRPGRLTQERIIDGIRTKVPLSLPEEELRPRRAWLRWIIPAALGLGAISLAWLLRRMG